jgi:hypothetical protein
MARGDLFELLLEPVHSLLKPFRGCLFGRQRGHCLGLELMDRPPEFPADQWPSQEYGCSGPAHEQQYPGHLTPPLPRTRQ